LVTALVQVIKISTGSVVYQHNYRATTPAVPLLVSSSLDGHYLVEASAYERAATIRDVTTGQTIFTLSGQQIQGLSWDGARAISTNAVSGGDDIREVDLATQKILWEQVANFGGFVAHQKSADVLVALMPAGSSDAFLLPSDGHARIFAHDAVLVSPCPCLGAGSGA
jgi:hypothetical protein